MPKTHVGALSGVTYSIPALTDTRNVETAFQGFANTLPASPPVMTVAALTASGTAVANRLYISSGSTPLTLTLPSTATSGDKISVAQVGSGVVTISGIGAGVPVTAGANTAVTVVWDGTKWVGLPFSFSGIRPTESTGGTVPTVDLSGFRYHSFTTPGTYTFTSHKALSVDAYVIGGGANGTAGGVPAAGQAGGGGVVSVVTARAIGDWTYTTIVVGGPGQASSFAGTVAAGGQLGGTTPATALTGAWATVIGKTTLGGPGASGPAAATTYGVGGGAGYDLLDPYPQQTETYTYTTGGTYDYDCSYGARSVQTQTGSTTVKGDPCVGGACPAGWSCQVSGYVPPFGSTYNCYTTVPVYTTTYACDSGGSLSGTTCVKTCQGSNLQTFTGTRPKACNSGYTAVDGTCVDSRSPLGGPGGGGGVFLRYAIP